MYYTCELRFSFFLAKLIRIAMSYTEFAPDLVQLNMPRCPYPAPALVSKGCKIADLASADDGAGAVYA